MSFDDQILFDEGGPLGHDGSWCAVNPVDGKLYMSRSDADPLILYAFDPWTWSLLGSMEIRNADGSALALPRVQGGVFSPNGHLYLTDSEEENIYLIDMLARRVAQTIAVANNHELEGLTILDLDQVVAPCRDPGQPPEELACRNGRLRGQLHVLDLTSEYSATGSDTGDFDEIHIHHFEVPVDQRYKI